MAVNNTIYWVQGTDPRLNTAYIGSASVSGTIFGSQNWAVVKYNGSQFVPAQADTLANSNAVGLAVNYDSGTADIIVRNGQVSGFTGLTTGATYYLSQSTAGQITTTIPSSGIVVPVGVALSATQLLTFVTNGVSSLQWSGDSTPQSGDVIFTQGTGITISRTNRTFQIAENIQEYSIGSVSGNFAVDWANGFAQSVTLTGSSTITSMTNMVKAGAYILRVTQGGSGSNTLSYLGNVYWPNDVVPFLATTVGHHDFLTFYYNGTNFLGNDAGAYSVP